MKALSTEASKYEHLDALCEVVAGGRNTKLDCKKNLFHRCCSPPRCTNRQNPQHDGNYERLVLELGASCSSKSLTEKNPPSFCEKLLSYIQHLL